jgi:hypothetical protein
MEPYSGMSGSIPVAVLAEGTTLLETEFEFCLHRRIGRFPNRMTDPGSFLPTHY